MNVVWTKPAVSDLQAIRDYIARDSEHYAARMAGRIVAAVRLLKRSPFMGAVVPEFAEYEIRERLVQNYRIMYEVRQDRVQILAVVHASRDLKSTGIQPPDQPR